MLPDVIRRARVLLAGGWSEPMSTDAYGNDCFASDEGVVRLCLDDALRIAANGNIHVAVTIEQQLQERLRVSGSSDALCRWLQEPSRTLADVQQLLARVELHLAAKERR
jgi:hypothetical protein